MEKPQETHNVSSESPDSNSHKSDDAKPKSAYAKVYNSLGFNRGYNFPLCTFRPRRFFFHDWCPVNVFTDRSFQGSFSPAACWAFLFPVFQT